VIVDINILQKIFVLEKEATCIVKELNSEVAFFWSYEPKKVAVSGNTGSAPLIDSRVIRDYTSDGSVWSETGSSDLRSDAKLDAHCALPETDQMTDGAKRHLYCHSEAAGLDTFLLLGIAYCKASQAGEYRRSTSKWGLVLFWTKVNVWSSYSKREHALIAIWILMIAVASLAPYHWAIPL